MTIEKDLPQGWAFTKVEAIADLLRGISYKKDQASKEPMLDYKPVLRANNINGSLNFDDLVYVPASLINDEQFIKAGDIVFAMSSGSKHLVGKSARALSAYDGSYGAFCALLRPIDSISKDYIYFIFQSNDFRRRISETATGTNINNLKREHILDFEFPIPPFNEQKRIVAKIEELFAELDAGVASLELAQAQLQTYRQALLKHAFEGKLTAQWRTANADKLEDAATLLQRIQTERQAHHQAELATWKEEVKMWEAGGKNGRKPSKPRPPKDLPPLTPTELADLPQLPTGWATTTLEQLTEFITSGSRGWAKYYSDNGSTFIRAQNLKYDRLDLSDVAYVSIPNGAEGTRTKVCKGDLLVTITGANVTKTGYVKNELEDAYVNQHVALCRLVYPQLIQFVYYFVISDTGGRRVLEEAAYGAGKPGLNLTNLNELIIPLAPQKEQEIIVSEIESRITVIDQLGQTIIEAFQQAEALRQSILKKAFAGQLVPQDPTDEPASALLARIRAAKP